MTYLIKTVACDSDSVTVEATFVDEHRGGLVTLATRRTYQWSADDGYSFDYDSEERPPPAALSLALDTQASYGDHGEPTTAID